MTEKKKNQKYTTARGVFVWPKLAEADTKFDAAGAYSVKLKVDQEGFEACAAIIQPFFDDAVAEGEAAFAELSVAVRKKLKQITVNDWFTPVYDDDENETGEYTINFKAKASGKRKDGTTWSRGPIPAFDSKGARFTAVGKIWSGSEGKVSFTARPYFVPGTGTAGVSLGLEAVKVLQLAAAGGNADTYGFGDEEDGFDASDVADDVATTGAEDSTDDAGSDF